MPALAARRLCGQCGAVLRRGNPSRLCDPCGRSARMAAGKIELPSDFYARPDVIAALAGYDFGTFFKTVRAALHVTQDEFGRLSGLAQSRICKVENGALRLRDVGTIAHLAQVLRVPAGLLGFAPESDTAGNEGRVDWMDRRDFMAVVTALAVGAPTEAAGSRGWNARTVGAAMPADAIDLPRRIGASDVARIEAMTETFRDWDHRWGGGYSRTAVNSQLGWVLAISKQAVIPTETVRRRLLVATADLANVAAFSHYDTEQHGAARRLWMVTLDAAREGHNPDLAGHALRYLAHQALHLGRPDEALRLLRLAYVMTGDPEHTAPNLASASIACLEAWGHAAAGDAARCDRTVDKATTFFTDSRHEDSPHWLAFFNETELHAVQGYAYDLLAERVQGGGTRAISVLEEVVTHFGPEYARSRTINLIGLASANFRDPDHVANGISAGYRALDGLRTLNSPRALTRLRRLDRVCRLPRAWDHVEPVSATVMGPLGCQ